MLTIKELMDKLGVGFVPGPDESVPYSFSDVEKGVTCSAEVRMGMDSGEVEAEIQLLFDRPLEGKGPMEHIGFLRAAPIHEGQWTTTDFKFRGLPYGKDIYGWQEKACLFFQLCVQDIQNGVMPKFDELLDDAFHKRERFADQRGGGGGKSPKIKPGQLLNMKKGQGF